MAIKKVYECPVCGDTRKRKSDIFFHLETSHIKMLDAESGKEVKP